MKTPPLLRPGNKIALIAPAGVVPLNSLENATETLISWGLEIVRGDHVYNRDNYFSGTDSERLNDLQKAFNDPAISAILSARGGYGTTRILHQLDFDEFDRNPKWMIGYSDITALLLQLQKHRIASIHGPMATSFNNKAGANSVEALRRLLFDGVSRLSTPEPSVNPGTVTAGITGGNLSLLVDSLGTANEVDTRGKILFLEEVGERTYRIDRMLNQLLRANKFRNLAGLVIGDFSDIGEGNTPFGSSWKDCIANITKDFDYPITTGWQIGHKPDNMPVMIGGEYELDAQNTGATLDLKSQS